MFTIGTYDENIVVNKIINLIGASEEKQLSTMIKTDMVKLTLCL